MAATRSQRIYLAIFMITMSLILGATLVYMLGRNVLQSMDVYYVNLQGGSSGLEMGSQVRFNGIVVGRVDDVALDSEDPSLVRLTLSVKGGTPINEHTVAVPELTGLTGSKRLALNGGNKDSKKLQSGDTIPSAKDDFSAITVRLNSISLRIEKLLENLNQLTSGENGKAIGKTIAHAEQILGNIFGFRDLK